MSKLTKEEQEKIIKDAEEWRDNAPVMDEESARHLHEKWKKDSESFNERMIRSKDDKPS